MFNAGVGNCHNGGHPEELYDTFDQQLHGLDDNTLIYPGHEYLIGNLKFTLAREPDNATARQLLADVENQDPDDALVTTLGQEREINTFFRLDKPRPGSGQVLDGYRLVAGKQSGSFGYTGREGGGRRAPADTLICWCRLGRAEPW